MTIRTVPSASKRDRDDRWVSDRFLGGKAVNIAGKSD